MSFPKIDMKKFMKEHYTDFDDYQFVKDCKAEEWVEEVDAMLDLANIEIQKMLPINPEINHWIDQYHKLLKDKVKSKIESLKRENDR